MEARQTHVQAPGVAIHKHRQHPRQAVANFLPGDAAVVRAGPYATEEKVQEIRDAYGLSDPMAEQFTDYVGGVFTGDFGTSIRTNGDVFDELMDRLPASLELAFYSVLLAAIIGIPFGVIAAARRGTWVDGVARVDEPGVLVFLPHLHRAAHRPHGIAGAWVGVVDRGAVWAQGGCGGADLLEKSAQIPRVSRIHVLKN